MTITINGTTGIAGVDGSAGTPAVQGTDTNTGIYFGSDTISFAEGGAEVARFDSSGNLLVNTTTAQTGAKLAVTGGIQGTITSGTSVASTSGTSIDFTGIPSWVKRITVMFSGVSTNGTSNYLIQLGDSGGIETTGYTSAGGYIQNAAASAVSTSTAGFIFNSGASTNLFFGSATICLIGSNSWAAQGLMVAASVPFMMAGGKTLSDTLTQVRITTVNGTDAFDAGTINILYEG